MAMTDGSLSERVARERYAADGEQLYEHVRRIRQRFDHVFTCPEVASAERWRADLLERLIPGSAMLDYGCYDGAITQNYLAKGPKKLVGIDISETAIARAQARLGDRAAFHVADAHDLSRFADESFDLIVGDGILHHLDLEIAIPEIHRLLRPGGSAVFTEPLLDNPAAKLWRWCTPKARTADERPLSARAVQYIDSMFERSDHRFCSLVSSPVAILTSLTPLEADNAALKACHAVDQSLTRTPLKWWYRALYAHWMR